MAVNKEKYNLRILNNLCTRCGEPVVIGKKQCQHHLDEAALKEKLKRERRRNKNLCLRCGKVPPRENKIYCEECFKKDKKYDYCHKNVYYKRKNNSQCTRCGIKINTENGFHCENCKIYTKAKDKIIYYHNKNNNRCTMCHKTLDIDGVLCSKCKIINNDRSKIIRQKQKKTIIDHYGGKCACCGEENLIFLELDHINGGGNKHRNQLRKDGTTIYRSIINNNFPPGFQVLCASCNVGRYRNGGICPHQQKLTEDVGIISVGLLTQEEK